jgi:isoaspartyl peptidase/L-asparaginase-like protein (Ntn-hydrolase superfamily)
MSTTDFVSPLKTMFNTTKSVTNVNSLKNPIKATEDIKNKDNIFNEMAFGSLGAQYNREQATADQAKKQANEAVLAAKKLADEQDQAFNKANMKKPNYLGIKSNNSVTDTTLLGGGGSSAPLGKSTLLGR